MKIKLLLVFLLPLTLTGCSTQTKSNTEKQRTPASSTAGISGQTTVLGSMDPDLIRGIVSSHVSSFQNCYQKDLASGGISQGLVKLRFTIGSSGSVTKASATSFDSNFSSSLKGCLEKTLGILSFKESRAEEQLKSLNH